MFSGPLTVKKANRADLPLTPQQQKENEKEKQREEEPVFFLCTDEKRQRGDGAAPGGTLVQVVPLGRMEGWRDGGSRGRGGELVRTEGRKCLHVVPPRPSTAPLISSVQSRARSPRLI